MTALNHDTAGASMPQTRAAPARKRRHADERTFQMLFLVSFPFFLAVALSARVLPGLHKQGDDSANRRGSLLAEAAAAARSTLAIALTD